MIRACQQLADQLARRDGAVPPGGLEASADTGEEISGQAAVSRHAFGAQFAEVRGRRR